MIIVLFAESYEPATFTNLRLNLNPDRWEAFPRLLPHPQV